MGYIFKLFLFLIIYFISINNLFSESLLNINNNFNFPEKSEEFSGGDGTIKVNNKNSFSLPMKNLRSDQKINFLIGNGLFKREWLPAPSIKKSSDGLGPLFNAKSCQGCHIRDGRGHPPNLMLEFDDAISMVFHLSIPPQNEEDFKLLNAYKTKSISDPIYGDQLSDFAIDGLKPEGQIHIDYEYIPVAFDNGTIITLSKPLYSIKNLNYGDLHPNIQISARVAQPMIGLGLIQYIHQKDILANEDPNDKNNDLISGIANRVWNINTGKLELGRFGWKASQPSIMQHSADAFHNDMGLSTSLFPKSENCTELQDVCYLFENGNGTKINSYEVSNEQLALVEFYSSHIAVPLRRSHDDNQVLKGKKIFYESGCVACHTPKFKTVNTIYSDALSSQLIWPYSDFLLHDMGEGLADKVSAYDASGNEWRTQPLWGIGLTKEVNGHTNFLHDGRANSLLEAILWHGGEAESSKQKILKLSVEEVENLIKFIESL
ncbi:c-type cytochrome [Pelagibacteraceae bacterium]|nr:c-type cytochrome [Pelagibacteraceae bacterium]